MVVVKRIFGYLSVFRASWAVVLGFPNNPIHVKPYVGGVASQGSGVNDSESMGPKLQVSLPEDKLLKEIIWVIPIQRRRFVVDCKEDG